MVELDRCDINCIHDEAVQAVRQALFGEDVAASLAELFKALGDPTRVKILFSLMTRELCVCDLTAVIGVSDSAVSHQLKAPNFTSCQVPEGRQDPVLFTG